MSLKNSHQNMKELIALKLENRGFSVKMEKRIYCPEDIAPPDRDYQYKQTWFSIDVYGERNGEIVMYEIGRCRKAKLDWLRKYIGKVIHMPFFTQWVPGFYYKQKEKIILTDEENQLATPNISSRKW